MKRFLATLLISICCSIAAVAQSSSAPPYRGPLDASVSVPATWKGQNYKITGDRLGGSGIDTSYVDSLNALNDWQMVMERGNTTDRAAIITGNAELSSNLSGLRLEYDEGTSLGVISKSNGLAGVGASIVLGNDFWAIEQPSGTMTFGTESAGSDYRFSFSHQVAGAVALQDDEFVTLGQIMDSINAHTDTATVTVIGGIGTVEALLATDSYGIIRWTNNTGSPAGQGVHIKVTYSTAYQVFAVPVVTPYVTTTQLISMAIASPVVASFDVELGQDIPDGESVGFTYHVKGK